ncbi:MAG: RibD family protein [Deltaproteobacteria bacterium]|nr:RibD family protein [Deltaproteobacteria bacterium]
MAVLERVHSVLLNAADHRRRTGRPLVTLTYAQSLDGSIAVRPGRPLALSGPQSQTLTHALRAVHDAILVGIGTVLADNPRLTVRLVAGADPQPVVLDSRLRFPLYANLLQRNGLAPWIATSPQAEAERRETLRRAGARLLLLPTGADGWIDLAALLSRLAELDVDSLMVEGGAQIITSFLASRLVDQVVVTIAPLLVGGLGVVDKFSLPHPCTFPRLRRLTYEQAGEDLILMGEPEWSAE